MALARLQADDDSGSPPPRGLRPFLRFTRLPDRAVTAARKVLDEDEGFRDQVRRSTSEDRVGRASWLFLDRPEGWENELEALIAVASQEAGEASQRQAESAVSKRLAVAHAARRRAEEAAARLGAELVETKELVASERRARRRLETDAGRSRRRSNDLEAEVAELRSLVARLQETLEGAPEAEPRGGDGVEVGAPAAEAGSPAGVELDFDPRALAATYGAVLQAADGISVALADLGRELAPLLDVEERTGPALPVPPSPAPGPAPARPRQPAALPPAILDDSVEAAEHLLRTEGVVVLVDGYNLTKLARPEMTLVEQRRWLVDAAMETATRTGARFEVVFDGADDQGSAPADLARRAGVQVRFSPAGVDADDVVLERARAPGQGPVVVASDDRRVRDGARRLGANVVGAAQLLAAMKRSLNR